MNPIEEQRQIIDKLYQLVHASAPVGYSEAACRFRYFREVDGSEAVDEQFWYFLGDKWISGFLCEDPTLNPMLVVPQLHTKMKAHTGGDWQAFTLTINLDGSVTTKFEYQDQTTSS